MQAHEIVQLIRVPSVRLFIGSLVALAIIGLTGPLLGDARTLLYLLIAFVYFSAAARVSGDGDEPRLLPYLQTFLNMALVTLVIVRVRDHITVDTLYLLYVVPVLVGSLRYGGRVGNLTAVLSMVMYAYVFVAPPFSLIVYDLSDFLALVVFMMVATVTSQLADNERRQKQAAILARQQAEALDEENRRLFREAQVAESLRSLNRMKTELLATVSHELRTPLSVIKAYTTALMRTDVQRSTATAREFLGVIDEETDKLGGMISELLDLSKIEAGVLAVDRGAVPPARLVQRCVQQFTDRHPDYHFELIAAPSLPVIEADPRRTEQVLRNLLENAVKYSEPGTRIRVGVDGPIGSDQIVLKYGGQAPADGGPWVVIWVTDEGIGIAPEELGRLFEPFHRVPVADGVYREGSGLGLAICRGLVEAQGGRIWLRSEPGQGSVFAFALPVYSRPADDGGEQRAVQVRDGSVALAGRPVEVS